MTGLERAIKAMNFEATDRLPIMANGVSAQFVQWFLGISEENYWADQRTHHYETMRRLGQDFHIQMWFPPREKKKKWSSGREDGFGDNVEAIAAEMERLSVECDLNAEELDKSREARIQDIMDYQLAVQAEVGDEILWIFGMDSHGPRIVGLDYGRFGYEGYFLAVAMCPDVVGDYIGAQARLSCIHNECVVEAAGRLNWPRIGYTGADMTTQRSNMIHPKVMDRIYFPHLDYALKPLVENNFKIVWHSDGYMNDMVPPLIDIGVAGFQGFQEECGTLIKDMAKLRNRNGDPLILWGSCSVLEVIRVGDFDDIRREVQRVLDEWPHPGLCLATPTYLDEDVPFENIVEFYRLCGEMGRVQRS